MKCGVVDLGSNTVRLSVYRCEGVSLERILSDQKTVGLAGYVQNGSLTPEGIAAACRAIDHCHRLLSALDIGPLFVFATASLRNISNTAEVLQAIKAGTGVSVEVLSGEEEAALSFRGTVVSSPYPNGLLADIGGGSTELLFVRDGAIQAAHSLPIGSLSFYRTHVSGLFPTPSERVALQDIAMREVARVLGSLPPCPLLLGAGGTIQSAAVLAGTLHGRGPDSICFPADEATFLLRQLQTGNRDALFTILQFVPERVHTLVPGLILLSTIVKVFGVETIRVSSTDIREGYLTERVLKGY